MTRGTDVFLSGSASGVRFVDMVLQLVQKVWSLNKDDMEKAAAARIAISMLQSCKGRLDDRLGPIVQLAAQTLAHATADGRPPGLRLKLAHVISAGMCYNAPATLAALAAGGDVPLKLWLDTIAGNVGKHRFMVDKKLSALGFIALFELPAASLPPPVQASFPALLEKTVLLLDRLRKQQAQEPLPEAEADASDVELDVSGEGESKRRIATRGWR